MLPASRQRIIEQLGDADVLLDIGGWADPLWRADWVMDLMPYETRGLYEREGWIGARDDPPDRFGPKTWIQRDVCDHQPYPFDDDSVDFVVCSHTLEDLRDPLWVCSEMTRIGKAGYIEVPSRLEEQSWGVVGEFVGWGHHRWLIDVGPGSIDFTQKLHSLHVEPEHYFPAGFAQALPEEARVQTMWWEGEFAYGEFVLHDDEENHAYLRPLVERGLAEYPLPRSRLSRRLRRAGS